MKKTAHLGIAVLTVITLMLTFISCSPGRYLRTTAAKEAEVTGTYNLILYGARYSDDIENVAIFDKEGDRYTFEVYAPEFDYRVKKGLSAEEALKEGEKLVSSHHAFRGSLLSRVLDNEGNAIGYELRPLYSPLDFGFSDVLEVDYTIKDTKVTVRIRLRTEIEKRLFGPNRPFLFE